MIKLASTVIAHVDHINSRFNTSSRILGYGLNRARSSDSGEDVQMAMEEGLLEIVPRLEKRTHYLAMFANIATLLGLLGTIIGLIKAFTAVEIHYFSEKYGMSYREVLEALVEAGLGSMPGGGYSSRNGEWQTKS